MRVDPFTGFRSMGVRAKNVIYKSHIQRGHISPIRRNTLGILHPTKFNENWHLNRGR